MGFRWARNATLSWQESVRQESFQPDVRALTDEVRLTGVVARPAACAGKLGSHLAIPMLVREKRQAPRAHPHTTGLRSRGCFGKPLLKAKVIVKS